MRKHTVSNISALSLMPSKGLNSVAVNMSAVDMRTAFLTVLDNEEVINKLAPLLSASINLIFYEKILPLVKKIDTFIADNVLAETN